MSITKGDGQALLEAASRLNYEGIVSKRCDAPYRSDRVEAWQKIKTVQREKFPVVGFVKDPAGVAALYLGKKEGKELRYMGKVGTGWSRTVSGQIKKQLETVVSTKTKLTKPIKKPRATWFEPRFFAEIEYRDITSERFAEGQLVQRTFPKIGTLDVFCGNIGQPHEPATSLERLSTLKNSRLSARLDQMWRNRANIMTNLDGTICDGRHHMQVRIYFEDTDFGQIVYHANYLRFMERGRTNYLRLIGANHRALFEETKDEAPGFAFVVRSMAIDYLKPAYMDDVLDVFTTPVEVKGASITLLQQCKRGDDLLVEAKVKVAFVAGGKAQRIPQPLRLAMAVGLAK